jgi:O-methyltransferase involved in polyketide biosynthesis
MNATNVLGLEGVSETLLIPLFTRAQEGQRSDALLKDPIAVELIRQLDYDFSRIKLQKHDVLGLILRVREFDRFARDFLALHPQGVVVHLGCGFDTRFHRVDNGEVEWFDLDLPEVIDLRDRYIHVENQRYHLLAASMFESDWLETIKLQKPRPFLFLAEGVFPYFERESIQRLVRDLYTLFPGSELVFDAHQPWVVHTDNLQLILSRVKARLHFSLRHGKDVESWAEGIRLLEEWFYFGSDEPRLRPYRWLYKVPFLRKSTGIFHYRLGDPI